MDKPQAKMLPDDDPIFNDLPLGECVRRDGIFYVRESEWLAFLSLIARNFGAEDEFRRSVIN